MINYVALGKLVPSYKEIVVSRCLGSFDIFWDEIQRNHTHENEARVLNKNDWRGAYDRTLHFNGLDSFSLHRSELMDLDAIARYFLLGLSYKEWIRHFDREGFNKACPPDYDLSNAKAYSYD